MKTFVYFLLKRSKLKALKAVAPLTFVRFRPESFMALNDESLKHKIHACIESTARRLTELQVPFLILNIKCRYCCNIERASPNVARFENSDEWIQHLRFVFNMALMKSLNVNGQDYIPLWIFVKCKTIFSLLDKRTAIKEHQCAKETFLGNFMFKINLSYLQCRRKPSCVKTITAHLSIV